MTPLHLDTHVVVWLAAGETKLFPAAVRRKLESEPLAISPAVLLELEFLFEIGRIASGGEAVVDRLSAALGLTLEDVDFGALARSALRESWTRDPFDRFLVAHARLVDAPLLTRDRTIRKHYGAAVWVK